MGEHYLVFINVGLNLLLGSYILLLAPRRRVNQLFAFILIEPQLVNVLSIVGARLQSLPIAYVAAYARLFVDALAMAATLHFALTYPKRTRLSLGTLKKGMLFGLISFDAIAALFIGSQGVEAILWVVLLPGVLYGVIMVAFHPRGLSRVQFRKTLAVGALIPLMLATLITSMLSIGGIWPWLLIAAVTAMGTVLYMRRVCKAQGVLITPARWANWGRWQIPAIYVILVGFTAVLMPTGLPLIKLREFMYVVFLGAGSGTWLGVLQATAMALILLTLWENHQRAPREQRQPIRLLLIGFGSYFPLGVLRATFSQAWGLDIEWIGVLLSPLLTATVGLAIVKHRFLDAALNTVAEIVNSTLDIDAVLTMILEQLEAVIEFTNGGVVLVEGERLVIRAHTDQTVVGHSHSITDDAAIQRFLADRQPLLLSNMNQMPAKILRVIQREQMALCSWISVPLVARDQVVGIISVGHCDPYRYNKDDLDTLTPFAHQVAVAVDNARLYEVQKRRAAALARAQQLSAAISATLDLDEVLRTVTKELTALFGVDHSGIVLCDETQEHGHVAAEYPDTGVIGLKLALDYPAMHELIETQQPLAVADLENDARMGDARELLLEIGVRSILLAPLVVQGKVIGSLGLDTMQKQRHWATEDLDLCRIVSAQIASAVANAQAYEQEQRARRLADTLRKVSHVVGSTLDLDEVLHRILEELNNVLPYDGATVLWRDGDKLYARARRGDSGDEDLERGLPIDRYTTFIQVVETGEPVIIGDTTTDAQWVAEPGQLVRSWVGMPLKAKGQVAGMLSIKGYTPNMYSAADLSLVNAFATQVAIAVENARLYEVEVKQLEQELEIARRTQMSLLPAAAPDVPPFEVAGYSLPAREVGGDFFQYYPLADGRFGVAVGDVSGKGMNAALMMAVTTGTLDTVMLRATAPDVLLSIVNEVLTPHGRRSKLNSACCIAIFDTQNHTMSTANAGFIAPLLLRDATCDFVDVGGLPLGIIETVFYEEQTLNFEADDLFIFCSDGIVEAMNERAELYGFERLLARVAGIPRTSSAPAVIEWILQDVRGFVGGAEQHDDMTIVVVRVKSKE